MKKKTNIALLLIGASTFGALASCSSQNSEAFYQIANGRSEIELTAGETYSVDVSTYIGNKNYIKLNIKNDANLRGKFIYHNVDDSTQVVSEDFFLEPSDDYFEFKQYFDAYRKNCYGNFSKTLDRIEFCNINSTKCKFTLEGVYISSKALPTKETEIYLEKSSLKVGVDLSGGGTLTYLERKDYYGGTIDEIIDEDGNVAIGVNYKKDAKQVLSSNVNLINYYDAGRQFQQSFYASVGGTGITESQRQAYYGPTVPVGEEYPLSEKQNNYQRHWCYTASTDGYYWPYNPVQGGDCHKNVSQIIDYQKTKNYIYVKTRALDWAYDNSVTMSYMENKYQIDDGVLYVTNRFINWAGFTYDEYVPSHNLELPASYVVHPLHNLVVYKGTKPWTGDKNYDRQPALGSWKYGSYKNTVHKEDWFAWVNDDDFGVSCYIPGVGYYASGRSDASTSSTLSANNNAYDSTTVKEYLYNKPAPTSAYTSCYVSNTDYTAPVCQVIMKDYVPFTYTYVLSVDQLEVSRSLFKSLYEYEMIDNSGLKAWD